MVKKFAAGIFVAVLLLAHLQVDALATHGFDSWPVPFVVDDEEFVLWGYGGDWIPGSSFRLRDIAYILNGTPFQFDVREYNDEIWDIFMGEPYTVTGDELNPHTERRFALFGSYGRVHWYGFPDPIPATAMLHIDLWEVPPETTHVHLRVRGSMSTEDGWAQTLVVDEPGMAVEDFPAQFPLTGTGGTTLGIYSVDQSGEETFKYWRQVNFPDVALERQIILRIHGAGDEVAYHTFYALNDIDAPYFYLDRLGELFGFDFERTWEAGVGTVYTMITTPYDEYDYEATEYEEPEEYALPDDREQEIEDDAGPSNFRTIILWVAFLAPLAGWLVWKWLRKGKR